MIKVKVRELAHNLSHYLKLAEEGERIVVYHRDKPVADLITHNENIEYPSWKKPVIKIKNKGVSMSELIVKMRREENR